MSELRTEHEGEIEFTVIQTAGQEAESGVEEYDVGNHGLVVFDDSGEVLKQIPGHDLEKVELSEICDDLLAGTL